MMPDPRDMGIQMNLSEIDMERIHYNTSQEETSFPKRTVDPLMLAHFRYNFYGYPIILAIGSIGNILAYLVFTRTGLRKISSLQYLAAIAITDTGFLWTFIFTPLYTNHNVPVIVQAGLCQLVTFLNYVFTFLSIWYLVAMVVEKFIGVYWPLKKATMCTAFRAKLVMSFMAVIAVACYSYMGYFIGPYTANGMLLCMPWRELQQHFANLSKIDTIVVAVIPYCVIIILTTLIVIRGCEYYRISAAVELWPRHTGTGSGNSPSQALRVTGILFPVIIFSVLCSVPVMTLRTIFGVLEIRTVKLSKLNTIFYEFYILNFASKFLVYMLCSSTFRKKCASLMRSGYICLKNACTGDASASNDTQQNIHLQHLPQARSVDLTGIKTYV